MKSSRGAEAFGRMADLVRRIWIYLTEFLLGDLECELFSTLPAFAEPGSDQILILPITLDKRIANCIIAYGFAHCLPVAYWKIRGSVE